MCLPRYQHPMASDLATLTRIRIMFAKDHAGDARQGGPEHGNIFELSDLPPTQVPIYLPNSPSKCPCVQSGSGYHIDPLIPLDPNRS